VPKKPEKIFPKRSNSFNEIDIKPSDLSTNELIGNQSYGGRIFKRMGDIIFSSSVIIFGMPIFIILAVIVRISSPGPIFYIQERVGRNYKSFGCIKFRTMYQDADIKLEKILAESLQMREEFESDYKLRKDPRITPIGRVLRRSSLDELPQFLNVLKGEMSVVGPRPIVIDELDRYGFSMDEVISVRPGLTGLWQVSGRNNLSYRKRVEIDTYYARNRNLLLDLEIILLTFGVLFFPMDRGAY
tara:strand:+ start:526 stop:1254 length:729 start_codon:yes stop_codon:yes gene_type:complete